MFKWVAILPQVAELVGEVVAVLKGIGDDEIGADSDQALIERLVAVVEVRQAEAERPVVVRDPLAVVD